MKKVLKKKTVKKVVKTKKAVKPMTASQIIDSLAETTELTKNQVKSVLQAQLDLAYDNCKNGFTINGLGKLVIVDRKARMGRNPATGETIKIKAKKVLKFRLSKKAKDAVFG